MLNVSQGDRKEISSKLMDVGNLTLGAITLGQAFARESFNIIVAVLGIFIWVSIYGVALFVRKGGKIWKTK